MIKSYVNDGALNHESNEETQKSELAGGPEVCYRRSKASGPERDGGMQRQMCMGRQFQDWSGHHRA